MSTITLNEKIDRRSQKLTEGFLQNKTPLWNKAFDLWSKCTMPSSKEEFWKYIKPDQLWPEAMVSAKKVSAKIDLPNIKGNVLVFIDGYFDQNQSIILDQNIVIQSIKDIKSFEDIGSLHGLDTVFSIANFLYAQDGVHIHIPKKIKLEYPIYLHYISTQDQSATFIRNIVHVESESDVQIIQNYSSAPLDVHVFENIVHEVWVRENARLEWITIQNQNTNTHHIESTHVQLKTNAHFQSHCFSIGGQMIRNNIQLDLDGTGIDAHLYGVSNIKNQQVVDHHTYIAHNQPHCESTEMYKHIVADKATSVFNGKIYVKKDAQKTNAFQSSQNILLSDTAKAYSKPELEIYADDVKCSHGSTTGQLNEEAKFYLKTRGIGEEKATQLLLTAFVEEVLEKITNQELKTYVEQQISIR
jgi:Fe-S cluster assembly protein SufD